MISESGKQWFNELVNQWANESINQQSSESTNQWTNEWMIEQTNERNDTKWNKMKWNEWVNQSMKQWTIESSNQGTKEPRNQGTKEPRWMNQWISESTILPKSSSKSALRPEAFTNVCVWNRARTTVTCTFYRPHFPKQLRTFQFLTMFMLRRFLIAVSCSFVLWDPQFFPISMWNSGLTTVFHTFCQPHLPKELRACELLANFIWHGVLAIQSRAHFADLIFEKWSKLDCCF